MKIKGISYGANAFTVNTYFYFCIFKYNLDENIMFKILIPTVKISQHF